MSIFKHLSAGMTIPGMVLFLSFFLNTPVNGQVVVGLDNWFNAEVHPKTGYPFHYLWDDTNDSGYSRWGEIFTSKGARIVKMYKPDVESLNSIQVYIIVDPDSIVENPNPNYFGKQDIDNIVEWVRKGGVLIVLGNDVNHCGLSGVNKLLSRFGMTFNPVMLHPVVNNQYEMGAYTSLPDHPVFKGVRKIYMKEVASIKLSGNCAPVLTEDGQAVMAECRYGTGFVFAVGDPWIYNEYIDNDRLPDSFENRKAAVNLTDYLISLVPKEKPPLTGE